MARMTIIPITVPTILQVNILGKELEKCAYGGDDRCCRYTHPEQQITGPV